MLRKPLPKYEHVHYILGAEVKAREAKTAELGLREQNKLQTRQRIQTAVRELFSKRGYDEATLRGNRQTRARRSRHIVQLCRRQARLGLPHRQRGTGRGHGQRAGRSQAEHRSLMDQLMAIFRCHYNYFARNPVLSRILLRELVFYSSGKQAEKFHEIRRRLMAAIEGLVREAQRARRIRSREDAALIARHIFFTFSAAVRWWIATPHPNPRTGLKDLRGLLKLQIRGLQPKGRS